jgi:hypothetical protein
MTRFLRFPKTLLAAALGAAFALAVPVSAAADHWGHRGIFLPFPPPPPFFFPGVVVHRHGPYCGHDYYGRYDHYGYYGDRFERRHDRHERRHDRHDRHHDRW